jgi:diguanylate cyclase (GGDEF)-like protein/PAS domain S-box-containing protein
MIRNHPPMRALVLSLAALTVPVAGAFWFPESLQDYEALLWLLAVVPAFLLAYYRGWIGIASGLAGVMAIISVTYAATQATGRDMPDLLLPIIVIVIALFLGIGALTGRVRRSAAAMDSASRFTDAATSLPNRAHAELHLQTEFDVARRGRPLAVVLFDVDNFEGYNTRHGTIAGDEVLRTISDALKRTTRRGNLAARVDDDEFMSVLSGADDDGAVGFVRRFQQTVRELAGQRPFPAISTGVASYTPSMRNPEQLIDAAAAALQQAKKEARGGLRVHGRKLNVQNFADGTPRVAEGSGEAEPSSFDIMPQGRGRGRKVLIVAAEAPVRGLLARYLTDHGFDVAQASNVVDGVQLLTEEYDIIFTDISLEENIGAELVRAAKLRWPSMQAIGLVEETDNDRLIETLNAGIDRYVLTPLDLAKVRHHITDLINRRERLAAPERASRQLSIELQAQTLEAMEALRRSEEEYRTIFRNVHEVIFRTDTSGVFTDLNEVWTETTGHAVDKSLGRPAAEFAHEEDRAPFAALLHDLVNGDRGDARGHVRVIASNGDVRSFDLRATRLFDADSSVVGVTGTLEDITAQRSAESDRRSLEEQLRQSQKLEAIGRLAGGLAHDFNNLLTVVQGNAYLLSDESLDTQAREYVQQIAQAAQRGANLVRQLLAFGRRQLMQPSIVNLNTVVENTRAMLSALIGEQIAVEYDLDPNLGNTEVDAGQMEQVLVSLVVYARQVMPTGGQLRIATRNGALALHGETGDDRQEEVVLMTVSDNGPGMDAETREHIFEPFFSTKNLAEASGLGLATVYGIVRQSGGVISVSSEPGRGTTFEIALPRIND